jgi:hypothetical protein
MCSLALGDETHLKGLKLKGIPKRAETEEVYYYRRNHSRAPHFVLHPIFFVLTDLSTHNLLGPRRAILNAHNLSLPLVLTLPGH